MEHFSAIRETRILIKGGGDLASGVALRLYRAGFPVIMTEIGHPLMVRRTVSFGEAIYNGESIVEGVRARHAPDAAAVPAILAEGTIPVLVDPDAVCRHALSPAVIVDAVMAKRNTGTALRDAPLVIGLGPGFTAGTDCHAVIETNRGHWLGRVIWEGPAEPDTGVPGEIGGRRAERVLHAPAGGVLRTLAEIGNTVSTGELIATVADREVRAPFDGVLRGLLRSGVTVQQGVKIGDVDPRAERAHCFTVSDKSLAVGGGVLEAILVYAQRTGSTQEQHP